MASRCAISPPSPAPDDGPGTPPAAGVRAPATGSASSWTGASTTERSAPAPTVPFSMRPSGPSCSCPVVPTTARTLTMRLSATNTSDRTGPPGARTVPPVTRNRLTACPMPHRPTRCVVARARNAVRRPHCGRDCGGPGRRRRAPRRGRPRAPAPPGRPGRSRPARATATARRRSASRTASSSPGPASATPPPSTTTSGSTVWASSATAPARCPATSARTAAASASPASTAASSVDAAVNAPSGAGHRAAMAVPDATASRQPRWPHSHSGPWGSIGRWPISPAAPWAPRRMRPSSSNPAARPVPTLR